MKLRFLVLLSGFFTLGFGYWLAEESRDAREIWVSMGAWVLGFWFASSILGPPRPDSESIDSEAVPDDEFEEYAEDDEFDDEERDDEERDE